MPEMNYWDEVSGTWKTVGSVNLIEWMPPQEENSPKMVSAINNGYTETLVTLDKPLLPFSFDDNEYAFHIIADSYWVKLVYPISDIVLVDSMTVKLIHEDVSETDGSILVGFNANKGTIRGQDGYLMLSHFLSYAAIYDYARIRVRDRYSLNLTPLATLPITENYNEGNCESQALNPYQNGVADIYTCDLAVLSSGLITIIPEYDEGSLATITLE